jgi:hypothetical protein
VLSKPAIHRLQRRIARCKKDLVSADGHWRLFARTTTPDAETIEASKWRCYSGATYHEQEAFFILEVHRLLARKPACLL